MVKKRSTMTGKKKSKTLREFRRTIEIDYKRNEDEKSTKERRDLLLWFVDGCPSKAGPEIAMKFDDYGIKFGADYSKLKESIINGIDLDKKRYDFLSGAKDVEEKYKKGQHDYMGGEIGQVIIFSKGEAGEIDSLYVRIRNAFAHGNYFKKSKYYYLWNEVSGKEYKLAAFTILTFKSLKQIHSVLGDFKSKY